MISQSFSHHGVIEGISTRVYFYRLHAAEFAETKKLTLLR